MYYSTEHSQYQQYQYQYQPPQQQQQQQQYDPSQIQAYDQSMTQAYYNYGYNNQQYQCNPFHDYSHSYPSQSQYNHHHKPASTHPPAVPIPPDPTRSGPFNQLQLNPGLDSGSGGPNPTTLSQPMQFAGNMDASHGALQLQIEPSTHKGGSRRGGRPFRRGGWGYSGHRGPKPDSSTPPFHGRGRGQGGGRHLSLHGAATTSNSSFPPAEGVGILMPPPSLVPGPAPAHAPMQVPAAPSWPPPQMAWCELCRVDCNTLEVLEQHKNGKRHKKNLQMREELQNIKKLITGQQNEQMPNSESNAEVPLPEKVVQPKENEALQVDLPFQATTDNNRSVTEKQKSKVSAAEPERKSRDRFEAGGCGVKRKMRGGRGGKHLRPNDGPKRPAEPSKPKEVIPFICELCNVKCESRVVLDSHLAGKKHLSNLKRFHGHQALYGQAGLQALYPPNINAASSSLIPQFQQGVNDPQVVLAQLLNYVFAQAQAPGLADAQVSGLVPVIQAASAPLSTPAPGSSLETRNHQGPTQGPEAGSKNDVTVEAEAQQQSIITEFEAPLTGIVDTRNKNKTITSKAKDISLPLDNVNDITLPEDDTRDVGLPQDSSVIAVEHEVGSLDQGGQPGPGNNMEDAESRKEEQGE